MNICGYEWLGLSPTLEDAKLHHYCTLSAGHTGPHTCHQFDTCGATQ